MYRFVPLAVALLAASAAAYAWSVDDVPGPPPPPPPGVIRLDVDGARAAATVDERFLSFAVDTAQVVGGDFWAPAGQGQGLLSTRPVPRYDFARPRLRRLAAALAPAYLRIGGTDADRTVYHLADGPAPPPPAGARWVLTRQRWDDVNEFARALDLRVAFTLNAGPSARDRRGQWDPAGARALVAYSRAHDYPIDIWELGNEVNGFPVAHGSWVSAARYADDLARARAMLDELGRPGLLAGPSSAFWPVLGEFRSFSEPVLRRAGALLDVVSWHYYPQQSRRCPVATRRARPGRLLPPEHLADVERWAARIEALTRAHAPRARVWLGETGGAQCGGEPGLSDAWADALWWLDELGRIARRGHQVVVRQTLSGSDYGLIDDRTLAPNPSYWASWLWRNLMGPRALAVTGDPASPALRSYVHCARSSAGAITALLINLDGATPVRVHLPAQAKEAAPTVFTLAAADGRLGDRRVLLNGCPLAPDAEGHPPALDHFALDAPDGGQVTVAPLSISFVVLPGAAVPACR